MMKYVFTFLCFPTFYLYIFIRFCVIVFLVISVFIFLSVYVFIYLLVYSFTYFLHFFVAVCLLGSCPSPFFLCGEGVRTGERQGR